MERPVSGVLESQHCVKAVQPELTKTEEWSGVQITNHGAYMQGIRRNFAPFLLQENGNDVRATFGKLVRVFGQVKMQAAVLNSSFCLASTERG